MLYWADRGNTAKIECSWLDGQERKVLVADGLGWPTGLSIDFTNGDRIYWSDSKESRIESVLPSGEDRRTAVYIGEIFVKKHNPSSSILHIFSNYFLNWSSVRPMTFCRTSPRREEPLQCQCVRGPCLLEHPGERRGVPAGQVWPRSQDQAADYGALADPGLCVPAAEIQLHRQ